MSNTNENVDIIHSQNIDSNGQNFDSIEILENLQRIANMGHWMWDIYEDKIVISEETRIILELDNKEEFISLENFRMLLYGTDFNEFPDVLQKIRETGNLNPRDFVIQLRNGRFKDVRLFGEFEKLNSNRIFGIIQDITLIKEKERALKKNLLYQEILLDITNKSLFNIELKQLMDRITKRTANAFNAEICSILEYNPKEDLFHQISRFKTYQNKNIDDMLNKDKFNVIKQVFLKDHVNFLENTIDEEFGSVDHNLKVSKITGCLSSVIKVDNKKWGLIGCQISTNTTFDSDDKKFLQTIANIIGSFVEKTQNLDKIQSNQYFYQSLLDQAGDGILILDENNKIVDCNQKLIKLLHYHKLELLGRYPDFLVNEAESKLMFNQLRQKGILIH
ncbi:MAG: PAS domain S-box protein, partial [Candidatus Heimdallarchaeota archaeon]|nr:PAS domain S-box protein [Candidatus Heimdallarchaeota archaeon]